MILIYLIDVSVALCALTLLRRLKSKRNTSLPLPPGPDGLPLIGNILDSRNDDMWETARRWGEKYGE